MRRRVRAVWEVRWLTSALLGFSWGVLFVAITFGRFTPLEIASLVIYLVALCSSLGEQGRAYRRGLKDGADIARESREYGVEVVAREIAERAAKYANEGELPPGVEIDVSSGKVTRDYGRNN